MEAGKDQPGRSPSPETELDSPPDPWGDDSVRSQVAADGFYRAPSIEIARGTPVGFDRLTPWPDDLDPGSAREAFEASILRALRHPPCVVAFSGGRDSSAILAVAVDLADRHGLPRPIAATHSFGGAGATDETEWQEMVIRHVGALDWHRIPSGRHFDVLGPTATDGLRRYGLLWPALAHCHFPILELASGGSIITGEGGDEVLGQQRSSPVIGTWRRRPRPSSRLVRELARAAGPRALRRQLIRRDIRRDAAGRWLTPDARGQFVRELAEARLSVPFRWDDGVRAWCAQRTATLGHWNMARVAADHDVVYHVPFLTRRFVEAWARHGGRWGYVTRREMMGVLFGDVLPAAVIDRRTKAFFNEVAVAVESRDFVNRWNGEGVDRTLVDVEALRREWLSESPHNLSMLLLQSAWLAHHDLPAVPQVPSA